MSRGCREDCVKANWRGSLQGAVERPDQRDNCRLFSPPPTHPACTYPAMGANNCLPHSPPPKLPCLWQARLPHAFIMPFVPSNHDHRRRGPALLKLPSSSHPFVPSGSILLQPCFHPACQTSRDSTTSFVSCKLPGLLRLPPTSHPICHIVAHGANTELFRILIAPSF